MATSREGERATDKECSQSGLLTPPPTPTSPCGFQFPGLGAGLDRGSAFTPWIPRGPSLLPLLPPFPILPTIASVAAAASAKQTSPGLDPRVMGMLHSYHSLGQLPWAALGAGDLALNRLLNPSVLTPTLPKDITLIPLYNYPVKKEAETDSRKHALEALVYPAAKKPFLLTEAEENSGKKRRGFSIDDIMK
ncbi:putative odd-skipped 2 protein-like [Homarus americanus]|uniref:Putative odd-skipped 2 protein-like n=1 Tax=Homarus americanus TaxID=6706 RepID=A0A8J5MKK8_HOMAM|nr:putative odd-skipped 2 protein-like [Homarus americanus]